MSFPGDGLGLGRQGVAESGDGVVESRSGGPGRDAEQLGDLDQGQPEVVVQDENRPLFDREPAICPLQFVAVGDGVGLVRGRRPANRQDPDVGRPVASPLRFVVAGVNEDPMDPRLEAICITEMREPPPGENEGTLQRVLGETAVAQDPVRDGVEDVTDLVHQDGERLAVAAAGPLDEVSIQPLDLCVTATPMAADYPL